MYQKKEFLKIKDPKESPTKIISVYLSKISEKFLEYDVKQIIFDLFFLDKIFLIFKFI